MRVVALLLTATCAWAIDSETARHMRGMKHAAFMQAPVVVQKEFCLSVLAGLKAKDEKYWDSDCDCCAEPRTDMLKQCEKQVDDFYTQLSEHCPTLAPPRTGDFHRTPYVEELPDSALPADVAAPCKKDPCEKELKSSPDGKPVKEWATYAEMPNADAEAKLEAKQEAAGVHCEAPPCGASDDMPPHVSVSNNAPLNVVETDVTPKIKEEAE